MTLPIGAGQSARPLARLIRAARGRAEGRPLEASRGLVVAAPGEAAATGTAAPASIFTRFGFVDAKVAAV